MIGYRDFREIFSYNFAFGGFDTFPSDEFLNEDRLIKCVTYVLELAELQSRLFSATYRKSYPTFHELLTLPFERASDYTGVLLAYSGNMQTPKLDYFMMMS